MWELNKRGINEGPMIAKIDKNQIMKGKVNHPSHRIVWLSQHDIMYCSRCGYYCSKRGGKLTQLCNMKPTSKAAKGRLKRMREGHHPTK